MNEGNAMSENLGSNKDISLYEAAGKYLSDVQKGIFDICNIKARNKAHNVGGHTDWVREIFITHDNTKAVSVSDDTTARLWDIKTGRCLAIYTGHTNTVRAVAVTPDDRLLVTGSWDRTIRIWELETGKCIKVLRGHTARIRSIVISSNGKTIYSGSEDTTARKWSLKTGKCLRIFAGHKKAIRVVAVTPDEKFLFTGSEDARIKRWDTKTGNLLDFINAHNGEVFALHINSTGTEMFSGGRDGVTVRWNLADNTCMMKYKGHKNWIMTISLSPDEKTILTGDLDGIIKLWDIDTPSCKYTLGGPTWGVNALRFNRTGSCIVFGSEHRAGIIDLKTGNCIAEFKGHSKNVSSLCLNRDNTILVTSGWDGIVNVWDIRTGKLLHKLTQRKIRGSGILSLFISSDNRYMVSGSDNGYIMLWDLSNGKCIRTINTKADNIHGICITPDMMHIIICCRELYENIKMYDFSTGVLVKHFKGHDNTVFSLDLSYDGSLLASGSADNTARIWNVKTGECLHVFYRHDDWVETVRISEDKKYLATGGCDLHVRVWEIETETLVHEYKGSSHTIYSVDISRDNTLVMAAGNDKIIRIWNIESGKLMEKLYGNDYQLYSALFDRTGKYIFSSGKYSLRMWSCESGRMIREFAGFLNSVCSLYVNPYTCEVLIGSWEFGARRIDINEARVTRVYRYCMSATYAVYMSHSGERIAAGGRCVLTNLLDASSGKQLRWFEHEETVNALLLNSRGNYLFTASSDHFLRKWNTDYIICPLTFKGHKGAVYDCKLSRDERRLYSCSADMTIKEWDAEKGICLKTYKGHTEGVNKIALSWDEYHLVSGSRDGVILVWETLTGIIIKRIEVKKMITALAITVDGTRIISGSHTGHISVWDSITGNCIITLTEHLGWVSGISLLENDNMMITSSYDGTVKFWTLDTYELRATYYNLNEGFLWTTPPDRNAPSGRFWTNRMDIINVIECEKEGEHPDILSDDHPERARYLKLYNNRDMVIKRINTRNLKNEQANTRPFMSQKTKLLERNNDYSV
ncbi:MAG: WD40 repeat domain-containing protein [Spirochaetales bacterium]|nr:WD40 repeat domain-containing protein [Spirochaetales bacterium]